MFSLLKNKVFMVSLSLAVAGILACTGALLDVYMPKGSVVGFFLHLFLLGSVVLGLLIGFTWVCDWRDEYLERYFDKILDKGNQKVNREKHPGGNQEGAVGAGNVCPHGSLFSRRKLMDLMTWLPAMFFLGLATFALIFACVSLCDKI